MSVDNFGEALGIFFMDLLHLVRILPVKFPCLEKMRAHVCIAPCHCQELIKQLPIHVFLRWIARSRRAKKTHRVSRPSDGAAQIHVFQQRESTIRSHDTR